MPKSKRTIPIYEYSKKVNGQTRYYIRPYINGKQITKRVDDNGNMWLGKKGYDLANDEIKKLEKQAITQSQEEKINLSFQVLKEKYLDEVKDILKEPSYISYQEVIKNQLEPFFNKDENSIINHQNILKWHEEMEKKTYSLNYKNKCHTILSEILNIGIKKMFLTINYEKEIGPFKQNKNLIQIDKNKIRYITYDEFNLFISKVKEQLWYTVFYTLYYTGMRKGELMALTWKDISFADKKIIINKTYTDRTKDGKYKIIPTKNYKNRTIDINESLYNVLLKWYEHEQNENFDINQFVFGRDKPISSTTMTNKKNKYFKEAGFDDPITMHEFRHSHVSLVINEAIKRNLDMNRIFLMLSDRMGHTIQVMQETYMHLFPNVQSEIVNILNEIY